MENKRVFNNFFWRLFERVGAQGVTLVVSVVLARILGPEISGTVALVTVFTTIMQVFVDSGMGNALIQKKNADDLDFSTVFYFNIAACVILYAVMFLCSPLIGSFYAMPELVSIVRVSSLTLLVSGVKNVQQAYVSRNMLFKRFFYSTIGGTLGAAVVGITMALLNFGVWALVAQNLFNVAVSTAILWITVKWRPKKMFSFERLRGLFSYGWKLLVSSLIETIYNDLRQMIIGKLYTEADLAYYNNGKRFPQFFVSNINSSIDSVLLPAMSTEQNDKERVKAMTRRAIKTSTYLILPFMVGLAVCAEPFVKLLLTEEWLPCVPYLRVFCFTMAFYPIHTANLNAIKAMGHSGIYLTLEVIKKIIGMTALVSTMFISVEAMAYSLLFTALTSSFINAFPNRKLLSYSYVEQILDMLPSVLLSCFMGAMVYLVTFLPINEYLMLMIQIPMGVLIYLAGSKIFKFDSFNYILTVGKSYLNKGNKGKS